MEKQYTPGPWRVGGSCTATCQGTNDPHILHGDAGTFSPLLAEVQSDGGRLPALANAALIASAPELLEALEGLLREARQAVGKHNVKKHYSLMVAEVAADKAIRKAIQ